MYSVNIISAATNQVAGAIEEQASYPVGSAEEGKQKIDELVLQLGLHHVGGKQYQKKGKTYRLAVEVD